MGETSDRKEKQSTGYGGMNQESSAEWNRILAVVLRRCSSCPPFTPFTAAQEGSQAWDDVVWASTEGHIRFGGGCSVESCCPILIKY